jgi:hypothetical protein
MERFCREHEYASGNYTERKPHRTVHDRQVKRQRPKPINREEKDQTGKSRSESRVALNQRVASVRRHRGDRAREARLALRALHSAGQRVTPDRAGSAARASVADRAAGHRGSGAGDRVAR